MFVVLGDQVVIFWRGLASYWERRLRKSRTVYSKINYPVPTLDPGQAEIYMGSGYLAQLHGGGDVE